ncbi:MAG: alpha-hydroxy acid oxidase [Polyangiaceae bacterium]
MSKASKTHGSSKKKFESRLTLRDFEKAAKKLLPKMARDYYRSGADDERALRRNVEAFSEYVVWYRVLVDVSERDLSTSVMGIDVSMPVLVAPTAYHRMAHDDGEIGTARAAAAEGTIYVASTLATTRLEEIADAVASPKWFQLYVHKDRGFTKELVERAETAGYEAIVLTVDTPLLGRRVRDERNGFALPEGLTMANLETSAEDHESGSLLSSYMKSRHDAALGWSDLEWLRSLSHLPLVLKGIVRADDARRAVDAGARAIVVSNHGGRQFDLAPATLHALPGVVDAVGDRAEVYLDGGVRSGNDVLIALGLGARAVFIGRPVLWGLAVEGESGVRQVLSILREELSLGMALAGMSSVKNIDRAAFTRAPRL